MDILLCTDNTKVTAFFSPLDKGRTHTLIRCNSEELQDRLKSLPGNFLIYLDVSSFPGQEGEKLIRHLAKEEHRRVGVIDPKGSIKDPAALFHLGAVDYLPKELLSEKMDTKRVKAVLDIRPFAKTNNYNEHTVLDKKHWITLPKGWKDVQSGKEYTFFLLYVELDMLDDWKKKSGVSHLDKIMETFHRHLEASFKPCNGKIWMWMNNGGLLLFPFDGKSCPCIEACLRLILNRRITTIEEYKYDTLITYTMALHLGNTVYKSRGKTGEIISDSINFLFHVGKKFAQAEHFYISKNVMPFLHPRMAEIFDTCGTFEGVELYSLKLPKK